MKMYCVEKNNIRTKEIEDLVSNLEIVLNNLNVALLEEESKLALTDNRLKELNIALEKLRNKKEKGLSEFLIATITFLFVLLGHLTVSFGYLFYLVLVLYLVRIPSYIKACMIIKNKDVEKLENVKVDLKNRVDNILFNKRTLEQQIWTTQLKIEEMSNEKSILEDINLYFTEEKELQRTRVREKNYKKTTKKID